MLCSTICTMTGNITQLPRDSVNRTKARKPFQYKHIALSKPSGITKGDYATIFKANHYASGHLRVGCISNILYSTSSSCIFNS